jgi:hypothetical protein
VLQEANKEWLNADDVDQASCMAIHAALEEFRNEAVSYRNQALYINKRAQSTSQSVLDSLNLGFQQLAQSQNKSTLSMARSAKEDSVAIRAITLVTSFYLPFSFVAVS